MEPETENESPRLQKVLADAGVASRRASATLITAGKVTVNGKIVREPGLHVNPHADAISVEGVPIETPKARKPLYIMLNKPVGFQCTVHDPHAEHTVMELVAQVTERLYPVGRLDVDSEGLLLMTNDGDFAHRLTHPRYHVPKVYRVVAKGFVERPAALKLAEGIELPDGRTAPAEVRFQGYNNATQCTLLEITLYEGRNRQIRRMLETIGHPVRSLQRVAYGNITLKRLNVGTWRKLTDHEVEGLLALAQPTPTPKKEERRIKPKFYTPRNPPKESPE